MLENNNNRKTTVIYIAKNIEEYKSLKRIHEIQEAKTVIVLLFAIWVVLWILRARMSELYEQYPRADSCYWVLTGVALAGIFILILNELIIWM